MMTEVNGTKCAWHEKEINKIQKHVGELFDQAGESRTFRGQVKIAAIIALSIFAASFLYTYNHTQDALVEYAAIHRDIKSMEARVDKIESSVMLGTDRYDRLLRDIDKIDEKISSIQDKLNKIDMTKVQKPTLESKLFPGYE